MKKTSALAVVLALAFMVVSIIPSQAHAGESSWKNKFDKQINKLELKLGQFRNNNQNSTDDKNDNGDKGNKNGENENEHGNRNHNDKGTTTPPFLGALRISNIKVVKATTTATISWSTGTSTYGEVRYGSAKPISTTTSILQSDGTFGTLHSVTLSNLSADTIYYYKISARDTSGNVRDSGQRQFHTNRVTSTVGDTIAPKIVYSATFQTMATSSRLIWFTDEPTTARVWLSTTTPVNTSIVPTLSFTDLTYFRNIVFNNLATSTTYYYTIFSTDASNNSTTLNGGTFTTLAI